MELVKSNREWISGGAGEDLVTIGDPRLKAPCRAIEISEETRAVFLQMVEHLRSLNGAGLAAPQVGLSVNAVVVEVRKTDVFPDRPVSPLIQMANPVILERSDQMVVDWEGCFSVPGIMGLVPRAEQISVSYVGMDGESNTATYSGYLARVIQHEVDHLSGIEFVDRMESMASLTTVKNYLEHHR